MITQAGVYILGLGVAIPATLTVLITIITKAVAGSNYDIKITQLSIYYVVAVLGWALAFGVRI